MTTLPAVSREYLYIPGIQAFDSRSPDAAADPTTLTVQVAFVSGNTEPSETDWIPAEWQSQQTARVLVGPGGSITLAAGRYSVWLRVLGAVERPERHVGSLTVR